MFPPVDHGDDATRHAALQAAIDMAIRSVDAGESIRVRAGDTRNFLRELGREATQVVDTRIARLRERILASADADFVEPMDAVCFEALRASIRGAAEGYAQPRNVRPGAPR